VILISSLSCWIFVAPNSPAIAPKISDFKAEYEKIFDSNSSLSESKESLVILKGYLAEKIALYGGNFYELYKVIECESSWKYNAVGDSGEAFGLLQFHKPTFDKFCKGEYKNPFDQIDCVIEMFNKGLQRHWTCFKNLK
jgi:hypothetical protein